MYICISVGLQDNLIIGVKQHQFDIDLSLIKVRVMEGYRHVSPFTETQIVKSRNLCLRHAQKLKLSLFVHMQDTNTSVNTATL